MPQRVLSVGQCGMDHGSISRLIEGQFDARVTPAATAHEALDLLRGGPFQLVLVNRVFDLDGGSGLDFVQTVKQDPALADTPVMLVSNYADAQRQAVASGGLEGFGKSDLSSAETARKLSAVLEAL